MRILHETDVAEQAVPGRLLRWVAQGESALASQLLSCCIMRVLPGQTVQPAHSHPGGEELLYFLRGSGKVYVDGEIRPVRKGSLVLFPQSCIHMVRNSGEEELKVICFFAPATGLSEYQFHPEVEFDQGVEA